MSHVKDLTVCKGHCFHLHLGIVNVKHYCVYCVCEKQVITYSNTMQVTTSVIKLPSINQYLFLFTYFGRDFYYMLVVLVYGMKTGDLAYFLCTGSLIYCL
jgi:hypothetical protein